MKFYIVIICALVIFYGIHAAPRPLRKRREITDKKTNENDKDKPHNNARSRDISKKQKSDNGQQYKKKQYVPIVPAYETQNVIREDSRPIQVVRIRDLSISNGVIERSNIVQI